MNAVVQIVIGIFLCVPPVVGLLAFLVINYVEFNKFAQQLKASEEQLNHSLEEPFSIADYYDRMIQVSEEIAREKAKRQYEPTVLWLLLDGLRINEDGTLEWVHKEKPKKDICIPPTTPESILYADNAPFYMTGVENCSVEDRLRMQYARLQYNLASQMANLQNQMQSQALITTWYVPGRI